MTNLNNDNFETFIASKKITLVLYDAPWSNHKQLREKLLAIEDEEKKIVDIDFGEVDIQKCPDIAKKLDVQNVPGIAYFFGGILVKSVSGIQQDPEETITNICRAAVYLEKLATHDTLTKTDAQDILDQMAADRWKWMKVKRFKPDDFPTIEERYEALAAHHVEETTFMLETIKKLCTLATK